MWLLADDVEGRQRKDNGEKLLRRPSILVESPLAWKCWSYYPKSIALKPLDTVSNDSSFD